MTATVALGSPTDDALVMPFPIPQTDSAREIQQNGAGDVVIPAGGGEVVVLPRLWDLDLTSIDAHGAVLSAPGLTVTVVFEDDSAAVIDVDDRTLALQGPA